MRIFTFTGSSTIERKFKIEIPADNYEEAEELALDLLNNADDDSYEKDNDDIEINIDEYEVSVISTDHCNDRAEY